MNDTGVIDDKLGDGFLKTVLDGITDTIKIIDSDFQLVYTNQAGLNTIDKPIKEVLGQGGKCFEQFSHSLEQCSYCVMEQVFSSGQPAHNSFEINKGLTPVVKEVSVFPLKDKAGKVQYAIEIVRDVTTLKNSFTIGEEFSNIISENEKMKDVFEVVASVAQTDSTVLINGDTGVGKELVARAIHKSSKRNNQHFLPINCGALSDSLLESELFGHEKGAFTGANQRRIGKFEQAHKGTVFLDEIGDISQAMQVKILRVLQEGEVTRVGGNDTIKVDVRFICATNKNLKRMSANGEFRDDLYYRINVIPVNLPPLHERGDDIKLLAEHYLAEFNKKIGKSHSGFTMKALNDMRRYSWPGNVRELKNLIERAVILSKGPMIEKIDIPLDDRGAMGGDPDAILELKDVAHQAERKYLVELLTSNNGNINKTAQLAGVNTRTIHRKMQEFGLEKEDFK